MAGGVVIDDRLFSVPIYSRNDPMSMLVSTAICYIDDRVLRFKLFPVGENRVEDADPGKEYHVMMPENMIEGTTQQLYGWVDSRSLVTFSWTYRSR